MSHQDSATVQLVLTFFRNLLEVPDEERQPGCGPGDGSKQVQVGRGGTGPGGGWVGFR
jgi:hypothetical protein